MSSKLAPPEDCVRVSQISLDPENARLREKVDRLERQMEQVLDMVTRSERERGELKREVGELKTSLQRLRTLTDQRDLANGRVQKCLIGSAVSTVPLGAGILTVCASGTVASLTGLGVGTVLTGGWLLVALGGTLLLCTAAGAIKNYWEKKKYDKQLQPILNNLPKEMREEMNK